VILGAVVLAAIPIAISTILILNRERIVQRQQRDSRKWFGRVGSAIAQGMTTTQVVVAAVAILVLGTVNLIGYLTDYNF
jgi:hypothetical protein